jgi:hypothetical protein
MFTSLLRSKKRAPSETTPLLAALSKFRRRRNGEPEEADDDVPGAVAQYDDDDDDDDEDNRGRDGSLLPVFSPAFLGMLSQMAYLFTRLTSPSRSRPHLQHDPRDPYNPRPTMRDDAVMGPAALAASLAVPRQAYPAADPLRPLLARHAILPLGELPAVQEGGRGESW